MHTLLQDLRYALRTLARQPTFAVTAVLCLAIGIGANATMFGVVDTLLLRPPPHVRDADRVVRLYQTRSMPGMGEYTSASLAYPDYVALGGAKDVFAQVAAVSGGETTLGRGPEAAPVTAAWASHTYFPLLGVRPALGRFYGAEEDRVGAAAKVVVLSHDFWRSRFGGDPDILGREIPLGKEPHTVVGVAPAGFTGVDLTRVDAWIPITAAPNEFVGIDVFGSRNMIWLNVVGRLAPGATERLATERAQAVVDASLVTEEEREEKAVLSLGPVLRARGPQGSREATISLWLAGVAMVVLLIACANVANLLLTRGVHRRREMAVRLALGVGRARLVRQLVTESLTIAVLGALGGLLVMAWGGSAIRFFLVPDIPSLAASVDERMLAFTAAAALLTGLLCGVVPALAASRPDLTAALKAGAGRGGAQRSPLRTGLQTAQVALTLVLLVGAGLFVRSLHNVRSLDLGFDAERVLLVSVDAEAGGLSRDQVPGLYESLLERAQGIPGVRSAAVAVSTPFRTSFGQTFRIPGRDSIPRLPTGGPYVNAVTPDFLETMGIEVRRGRGISAADGKGTAPVAVVNETMARLLWPGEEAIGKCFHSGGDDSPCRQIVGVVEDTRRNDLIEDPTPQFFVPLAQDDDLPVMRALFLRTDDDPERLAPSVRAALQGVSPDLPYVEAVPLRTLIDPQVRPWRLGATLFGIFGGTALLLALVGLYGVLAFHVSQRTHEIGVRVALGARGADVVRLFVGQGVRMTVAGVALGSLAAWAGSRALASQLFGVRPTDPLTFGAVVLLLLVAALAASYLPARRATRVDPLVALRTE